MADDGKALVGGMCATLAIVGAGFANATRQSIENVRQAKIDRIDELNAAMAGAHNAGMQIAHTDALNLATLALERVSDLEAENAILRKAVASRDRVLRSRPDA